MASKKIAAMHKSDAAKWIGSNIQQTCGPFLKQLMLSGIAGSIKKLGPTVSCFSSLVRLEYLSIDVDVR